MDNYQNLARAFYEEANMLHFSFKRKVLVYNTEKIKIDKKDTLYFENYPPLDKIFLKSK